MEKNHKIWAIIPAYNEAKTIGQVISETKRYVDEVVVVDDGSSDDTSKVALLSGARSLRHILNLGKGAALKSGCDYAISEGAEILVFLDADGQHEPKEIPQFLSALHAGAKVVFGYRAISGEMPLVFQVGNNGINWISQILFGIKLKDTQSGFRALWASVYPLIQWKSTDYCMESEMIAHIAHHRLAYTEIPIRTIYRDSYKGTTVMDGIKIVANMVRWKLFR